MKVCFVFWTVVLALSQPMWAQEANYPEFFSSAGTFFTFGSSNEYAYSTSTGSGLTSELTWDLPLSVGVWSSLGVRLSPHWEMDLRVQGAHALVSGSIKDQDWNIYDSDGNLITHQESTSDDYLDTNWEIRAEAVFPIPFFGMEGRPLVGAFYHQYYWEAWGGTLDVTPASGSPYEEAWYGLSLTFREDFFVPYVGFEVRKEESDWTWTAGLRVSPFLVENDTDSHILRQLTFNDSNMGGFMVEPSLSGSWTVLKNVKVTAQLAYQLIYGVRGSDTESSDGSSSSTNLFQTLNGVAGVDSQSFTAGLGLEVEF